MLFEIFAAEQLAEGKYIAEVEMILKWEKKGQKRMSIGEAADFFDASLPEINSTGLPGQNNRHNPFGGRF